MTRLIISLPFKVDVGKMKKIWCALAPSMNIQIREHFGAKMKRKKTISKLIRTQMGEENFSHEVVQEKNKKTGVYYEEDVWTWTKGPFAKANIIYRRGSTVLLDPIDNFGASFKNIGDVLVELGILADDKTECIASFIPKPHKVAKMKDQYIEVEIW